MAKRKVARATARKRAPRPGSERASSKTKNTKRSAGARKTASPKAKARSAAGKTAPRKARRTAGQAAGKTAARSTSATSGRAPSRKTARKTAGAPARKRTAAAVGGRKRAATKPAAAPARKAAPQRRRPPTRPAGGSALTRGATAATRPAGRKATTSSRGSAAPPARSRQPEPMPARKAPGLDRARRIVDDEDEDIVATPPSSLDLDRSASAVRSGRNHLRHRSEEHTETSPALTAGDVDADWESAYSVGDEAPGGDNPTPDQDIVDDIGKALGVQYEDNEELKGEKKISDRDRQRWELDPASSEDYKDRD